MDLHTVGSRKRSTGTAVGFCADSIRSTNPYGRERLCPICNRVFVSIKALCAHVRHCLNMEEDKTNSAMKNKRLRDLSGQHKNVSSNSQALFDGEITKSYEDLYNDPNDIDTEIGGFYVNASDGTSNHLYFMQRTNSQFTQTLQESIDKDRNDRQRQLDLEGFYTRENEDTDDFDVPVKPDATYLLYQMHVQDMYMADTQKQMKLRSLKMPNGSVARVLWEDYYDLYSFMEENNLSQETGDRLLDLINIMNKRHNVSLPLPKQYRTIAKAMKRHSDMYCGRSIVYDVKIPAVILNPDNPNDNSLSEDSNTIYATGARLSVMECVAEMYLQCDLVENINTVEASSTREQEPLKVSFKWRNATGREADNVTSVQRVVQDMISCEWFADIAQDILRYYGDDNIGVLNIVLSYDATSLTKVIGSIGRYATPVYVMLGNVLINDGKIPERAVTCIGYMPDMIIYQLLNKHGYHTSKALDYCYKLMKQHAEQTFLLDIIQEIDRTSSTGGILLQVGGPNTVNASIVHVIPVISMIVQDNQGAHKCLGVYSSAAARHPCRFCLTPVTRIYQPGTEDQLRNGKSIAMRTVKGCVGQLKIFKGRDYRRRVSDEELEALKYCKRNCIQATTVLAVHAVYTKHPVFRTRQSQTFMMCPPDEMHTVLGGLMKSWLFFVSTIVEQVGAHDPNTFGRNVVVLDERLQNFPTHCLPDILPKFTFHHGLSGLLEATKGSAETHTTSSLGGLSQQKYPHLIMQIILAIGIKGEILPVDKEWCTRNVACDPAEARSNRRKTFGVTETVLTSGITLLDLHFNLKRAFYTDEALQQLDLIIRNVQFHMVRLFALKQLLLGTKKKYAGIKLHVLSHMSLCIASFGPPYLFDMTKYDHMHIKFAKNKFSSTSGRYACILQQMVDKLRQSYHLRNMHSLIIQNTESQQGIVHGNTGSSIVLKHTTDVKRSAVYSNIGRRRSLVHTSKEVTVSNCSRIKIQYHTLNGILYEEVSNSRTVVFWYDKESEKYVTFHRNVNKKENQRSIIDVGLLVDEADAMAPLHPCLKCEDLFTEMSRVAEQDADIHMRRVTQGDAKYKCKLLSCIKFDGTPQELPVCTIHSSRSYKTSPESNVKIGRFDFLELKIIEETIPEGAMESDLHFAQVGAILAVIKRDQCVGLYILCMWMEELHSRNGPEWADLTPTSFRYLTYQRNAQNKVHRQLVKVDYILSPAFVTPVACKSRDLIRKTAGEMFKLRFTAVESGFFTRGGPSQCHLNHHIRCKQDNFPKHRSKILPFYLYGDNDDDKSPESRHFHEQYIPSFLISQFKYHSIDPQSEYAHQNNDQQQANEDISFLAQQDASYEDSNYQYTPFYHSSHDDCQSDLNYDSEQAQQCDDIYSVDTDVSSDL